MRKSPHPIINSKSGAGCPWPRFLLLILVLLAELALTACTQSSTQTQAPSGSAHTTSAAPAASSDRGRTIYQTQCIACHNPDPHKPGSIGPEVFGASKDLLQARILRGEYPAQYQPKRTTHIMAPLPHLKLEIDSIHLYLNSQE